MRDIALAHHERCSYPLPACDAFGHHDRPVLHTAAQKEAAKYMPPNEAFIAIPSNASVDTLGCRSLSSVLEDRTLVTAEDAKQMRATFKQRIVRMGDLPRTPSLQSSGALTAAMRRTPDATCAPLCLSLKLALDVHAHKRTPWAELPLAKIEGLEPLDSLGPEHQLHFVGKQRFVVV